MEDTFVTDTDYVSETPTIPKNIVGNEEADFVRVKKLGNTKTKQKKTRKRKYFNYSSNIALRRRSYRVHDSKLKNLMHGLIERLFFVKNKKTGELLLPPRPSEDAVTGENECNGLKSLTKQIINFVTNKRVRRMSLHQFVESSPPHKRKLYRQARTTFLTEGYKDRFSEISVFTKYEKVEVSEKIPVPRIISPRHPVYNLLLGSFLRPIEGLIFQALDELCGGPTVMKSYNAIETGTHIAEAFQQVEMCQDGVFVLSLDASRFDQHVSVEALKLEHSIYNTIYSGTEACTEDESNLLGKLLRGQLVTKGKSKINHDDGEEYCVEYLHKGGRCSGDMNTSLGNTILMVLMTKHIFDGFGYTNYRIINNGDDCLVVLPGNYDDFMSRHSFKEQFLKYGFNVKEEAEPALRIEHIEFCQSRPVCVDKEWTMVRNLNALDKDLLSLHSAEKQQMWITEIGKMGRVVSAGVPMYAAFYGAFPVLKEASKRDTTIHEGWLYRMSKRLTNEEVLREPSPETRISFFHAFGVDVCTQKALEKRYRSLKFKMKMDPRSYVSNDCGIMEWGF